MRRLMLVLSLLLVAVAPAAGSTQQHQLADQTAAWLTQVVGVEVPSQYVGLLPDDAHQEWTAASFPAEGKRYILASRHMLNQWATPRRVGFDPDAGRVMIHELLHGISMDEGAVDAVALDLLPAWSARFTPRARVGAAYVADVSNSSYVPLVRNVRGLSALETRGSWKTSAAQSWRLAWLLRTGRGE